MLTKLTQLVKRQGLFDDPTEEINNLIFRIKEDLGELNSKCDRAQEFVDDKKRQMVKFIACFIISLIRIFGVSFCMMPSSLAYDKLFGVSLLTPPLFIHSYLFLLLFGINDEGVDCSVIRSLGVVSRS